MCSAGETYLKLLEAAKAGAPDIHVHAFSPLEVRCDLYLLLCKPDTHTEGPALIIRCQGCK